MLQAISDRVNGWIAAVIVCIVAVAFSLFGVQYYINSIGSSSSVVAKVDGVKLTEQQLSRLYRQRVSQMPSLAMAASQIKAGVKEAIVKQWVSQQVVDSMLRHVDMKYSPVVIRQYIMSNPMFSQDGSFSKELFNRFLGMQGLSEQQYVQRLGQQMGAVSFFHGLQTSAIVFPSFIKKMNALLHQRRSFKYAMIDASDFTSAIKPAQQQLEQYYKKQSQEYTIPERVSVNYLMLSPSSVPMDLSDQALKRYYHARTARFTKLASWSFAEFSMSDLRSTYPAESNAALQKRFDNQLDMLKTKKGLNAFLKTEKVQTKTSTELSVAMIKLFSKLSVGHVSPIQTGDILRGKYVFVVTKHTPKIVQSFASVKNSLKKDLIKEKSQQWLSVKVDQMTNLAYSNPQGLGKVAEKMHLKLMHTPFFTRAGLKKGMASNKKFIAAAYSEVVLDQGMNSDPVTLSDGRIIILHVAKHDRARLPALAEVRGQVIKGYIQYKAKMMAVEKGQSYVNMAERKERHLPALIWRRQSNISLNNTKLNKTLLKAVFSHPFKKAANDFFVVPLTKGAAVVLLKNIKLSTTENNDTQSLKDLRKLLVAWRAKMLILAVQQDIKNHVKHKIYKIGGN